jgi:DNA primase
LSAEEELLEQTYCFYQRQLMQHDEARDYLARRGIHNTDVVGRMRIGYAPGACLRGFLTRLGYPRQALVKRGLIDDQHGRDCFFRCLTFPLVEAGSLYGRSIDSGICRHRFLPGSKGGLYEWDQPQQGSRIILVEGLLDVAVLWQAGFIEANTALGTHLNNLQLSQLCRSAARLVYICFDADHNGSGQRAARNLSIQLRHAGVEALRVALPEGHDPASFFVTGGTASDFQRCLDRARP